MTRNLKEPLAFDQNKDELELVRIKESFNFNRYKEKKRKTEVVRGKDEEDR